MNIQNWILFDKAGSNLSLTANPLIPLEFTSTSGVGATGFLVTDPSEQAVSAKITNSGYLYDGVVTASYSYLFDSGSTTLTSADASIVTADVSIFNPEGANTKIISSLTLSPTFSADLSTNFIYPSVTYAGAIFLEPVSVKLVETEHIFIFEETSIGALIRPYDNENRLISFKFFGDENQIQFFTVDENTQEITWCDEIIFDASIAVDDVPMTLNIGFRADDEGVYERTIGIYHIVGTEYRTLGEIVVNAQSVGEDERFRDLLANFGLPDPKDFKDIFKETDINEDMPDWEILNPKSKHMILEHDKIMPFVGTYKALIHALKWLGYDDIYVREWFKNVKENKKLSFIVPFEAKDRTQTILMFSPEERKIFKKLNELSLMYCITRETGQIDDWGTPITENCYSYNLKEIYVKLLALKQWLEKNIIGVNCRITDITGEGVYFERFLNLIYTTDNVGYNLSTQQSLSPTTISTSSELVSGDASICLTLKEITKTKIEDLAYRFIDLIDYLYDPSTGLSYHLTDASALAIDPSLDAFVKVGALFSFPFKNLKDIQWKLSVEKTTAGVIGCEQVTNPLFILENDIRFYNIFDSSSIFHNASTNLNLLLEKVYFRDPSIDEWTDSIAYSLYPTPSENGYILEASTGDIRLFDNYMNMRPETNAVLQYAVDANYRVPLLSANQYFSFIDASGTTNYFPKTYYLDIVDGKIVMDASGAQYIINFNYDTSLSEQKITLNVVYESDRMPLFVVDPSYYYSGDPSMHTGGNDASILAVDNSIYCMKVNHIGDYNIEVFGWDGYNTPFYNEMDGSYNVWIKHPAIYTLADNSTLMNYEASTYMSLNDVSILISQNKYPIYDRNIPLQGLSLEIDGNGDPYIKVPSITYFQDVPEANSINKFFNLTERVLDMDNPTVIIDQDYQKFYENDEIRLVKFDKGKYALIGEFNAQVAVAAGPENYRSLDLTTFPSWTLDSSSEVYILNDTYRTTKNANNVGANLVLDVSGYAFETGQLVGIIVTNGSTGYSWGASYRVTEVDGSIHTFDKTLPEFFVNNPGKYSIQVKHAFSSYADFSMSTDSATEANNEFNIYLKNSYCQEYYLDNTFVLVNVLFDQDIINSQWYNTSDNLINSEFFYYTKPINVDVSTLVILKAVYDVSTYLLNQKNIWTITNSLSNTTLMKVFNNNVPYIFDEKGYYDVKVESYDSYGNLITKNYQGLINVV